MTKTGTMLRTNQKFSQLVRRLAREGTAAERRTVTLNEVTGLIASTSPSTWAALRASYRATTTTKD